MTVVILHPNQERILARTVRPQALSARISAALTLDDGTVIPCPFCLYPMWGIVEGADDYMALKGNITSLHIRPATGNHDIYPTVFRIAWAVITALDTRHPLSRQWHVNASYWVKLPHIAQDS